MTFRAVVVGLGQIGMTYDLELNPNEYIHTHARAFHEHSAYTLVAGIDGDANRRQIFEEKYSVTALDGVDERLRGLAPDVVVIAVPTPLHAQVLKQVLALCTPRTVLCEKPLAYNLEEAQQIIDLCAKANCTLYVNYMRRADMAVQQIKQRLLNGAIAMPVKGVSWYSKGLFNNGSHFFDLLQYWLGEMQSFQLIQPGRSWEGDPEPDVLIKFAGGQINFIAAREEDYSHYTIELVSASGRLRYDQGGERVVWQSAIVSETLPDYKVLDTVEQKIETDLPRVQWHVADQLAKAMNGEETSLCSGEDALRTVEHLISIRNAI